MASARSDAVSVEQPRIGRRHVQWADGNAASSGPTRPLSRRFRVFPPPSRRRIRRDDGASGSSCHLAPGRVSGTALLRGGGRAQRISAPVSPIVLRAGRPVLASSDWLLPCPRWTPAGPRPIGTT
jgi:hypothetical protein